MSAFQKRVGFVDFKLENFHANIFLKIMRNELASRGFQIAGCYAMDAADGRAWSTKNNVPYFESVEAMNPHVDCFAVLAPSNPELHLELCAKTFPFGKTTYVDKTFAPSLDVAKRIFALADSHKVVMQTTSALRHTEVQDAVKEFGGTAQVRHIVAWGSGRSFDEYAIHPTEIAVSCLGPEVESLMRRGDSEQSQLLLNFSGGRTAVVNVFVNSKTPFAAAVTSKDATRYVAVDSGKLFVNMTQAMLDFFETGRASIDRRESLAIRAILDTAAQPEARQRFVPISY